MNFYYIIRKLEKTTELSQKSWFLRGQTCVEFDGFHGNVKNDGQTIDKSKFLQRMKKQLLEVSAP